MAQERTYRGREGLAYVFQAEDQDGHVAGLNEQITEVRINLLRQNAQAEDSFNLVLNPR